jgi:phosphate transport system substrate-binding protein
MCVKAFWLAALLFATGGFATASGRSIKAVHVSGSGVAYPLLPALLAAYREMTPDIAVKLIPIPLGSSGSIRAMAAGRIDVAIIGRELQDTDPANLAGQELGRSPIAFVVNGPTGQDSLSQRDVVEIYRGQSKNWPNGKPIRIILRPESDSDSKLIKALSPEISGAIAEARMRPGMAVATHDLENAEMLGRTPGALGTISLCQLQAQKLDLQPLSIDGGTPWDSHAQSRAFVVIIKKSARKEVHDFANFLFSAKAQQTLRDLNCLLRMD